MKFLFDTFPILVFFIVFKFYGIYIATGAAIILSVFQVLLYWMKHRNLPTLQLLSLALIVIFGGSTLILHNEVFIKLKPTVLYWMLAIAFLGSHFIGEKNLTQRMMELAVTLPETIWKRLNYLWVFFFTLMGGLNLFVANHFNTNTWVNFKLFGLLGLTFIFVTIQAFYLARQMHRGNPKNQPM